MRANAVIQRPYREQQVKKRTAASLSAQAKMKARDPKAYAAYRKRAEDRRRAAVEQSRAGVSTADLAEADAAAVAWILAAEFVCAYCEQPIPLGDQRTIDHAEAISRGGKHVVSNLRRACKACNSRKGVRSTYYA